MSYTKLQGMLAQEIYPSNNSDIPYPVITISGAASGLVVDSLRDATVNFNSPATIVYAGDIVYNTAAETSATVVSVIDGTTLLLNANIFTVGNEKYEIYSASSVLNLQNANNGCVLYIGKTGNIKVDTIAGSTVSFKVVPVGFFPVQVKKVYGTDGTTAEDIIALW